MKPAIIIVDMLEDNLAASPTGQREEEKIILPVAAFLKTCRRRSIPVIFACDSFLQDDFIFRSRMKQHAIRGTQGTKPLAALEPQESDIVLDKRRFSAFFKTDLDQTLRTLKIDTVAVGGINTHVCVLATAFDAIGHDFETVLLEDLCASYKKELHQNCLDAYRNSALYPLLRIMHSGDFLNDVPSEDFPARR